MWTHAASRTMARACSPFLAAAAHSPRFGIAVLIEIALLFKRCCADDQPRRSRSSLQDLRSAPAEIRQVSRRPVFIASLLIDFSLAPNRRNFAVVLPGMPEDFAAICTRYNCVCRLALADAAQRTMYRKPFHRGSGRADENMELDEQNDCDYGSP